MNGRRSGTGEGLPVPVKEGPHWRILIRPSQFKEERVETLAECWRLIESSRVSLRGWDYPHLSRDARSNGNDWIASWSDFRGHNEYWRFYQSGQFIHLLSFREDLYGEEVENRLRNSIMWMPEGFQPSGYVEVILTIYQITEVFEFATRLALRELFDESLQIEIEMHGVKDRVLAVSDPARTWGRFYRCDLETLSKNWVFEADHLISESAKLARQAMLWFFERFGWHDTSPQLLEAEQMNLLQRRV